MENDTQLLQKLATATAVLADVAAAPLLQLCDDELTQLVAAVESAGRFIDAARALGAAEIDERSRHELGSTGLSFRNGHRRPVHFLEQLTGAGQAELTGRIRLGKAIRPRLAMSGEILEPVHPRIAQSMVEGSMSRDSAAIIARCLDQATERASNPDDVLVAEQELVGVAASEPADIVGVHSRAWREALDPDGIEPREEERRQRRGITLGREAHGLVPISGLLTPTCAAKLRAIFSEANAPGATPRFLPDESAAATEIVTDEDGNPLRTITDSRNRGQRQHDALDGTLTAGIRNTGTEPGEMQSTAQVTAIVHLSDLTAESLHDLTDGHLTTDMSGAGEPLPASISPFEYAFSRPSGACTEGKKTVNTDYGPTSGYGWIDGIDEPASADTIKMLACDGGYRVVLFDDAGAALWIGRKQRPFTRRQRAALAARDGGCVICGAPASWCDVHHVKEWSADHGPTDIDNGVLLCPAHHQWIHHSDYQLAMIDGRPHLLAPFAADPTQTWRPVGGNRIHRTRALQKPKARPGPRAA